MGRPLSVGITLTSDPEKSRARLLLLCRALERATGLVLASPSTYPYHRLLEALEAGELDVAWLPPLLALRATGRGVVSPLALPIRHGVSTYSSALFTRTDSPVGQLADLEGASAAWVDPQSAAGYLVIRAKLRALGIEPDHAFEKNTFYGSHDAVVTAVLSGEADVGATFVYLDADSEGATPPPRRAGWGEQRVRTLCVADSIPSDMLVARSTLEVEIRGVLQDSLVSEEHPEVVRAAAELLGADGFLAPSREHLEALTTTLSHLEEAPRSVRVAAPT